MDVRVRRLREDEALLAAALHVQALRASGRTPPPGHLDRFAASWLAGGPALPQWVAEVDGEHCGTVLVRLPVPLPPEVSERRPLAEVALLYAGPAGPGQERRRELVARRLLTAALAWAAEQGWTGLELADDVALPAPVLDALGAQVRPTHQRVVPAAVHAAGAVRS
jgi:hypothetical protein